MLSFKPNFIASAFEQFPFLSRSPVDTPMIHPLPLERGAMTDLSSEKCAEQYAEQYIVGALEKQPRQISVPLARCLYPLSHRGLLPTYFRHIRVIGRQNLPRQGPVILAPTHRSRWDGLLVTYAAGQHVMGRYLHYMVTADEMQGLQGWVIRRMGGFPIDTRAPGIKSLRHGIELLQQRQVVVIFPEGGELLENRQVGLNRLHPGLGRLALQAYQNDPSCDVQIVPMAINYSRFDVGRFDVGRCDVEVQIGTAIAVRDYQDARTKRNAQRITADLTQAMRRLSHLNEPALV